MNNFLSVKTGIYETGYSAVFHRNGDVTVREPFVKWNGNTGVLSFRKTRLSGREAGAVREFFTAGELVLSANNGGGALSLDDVLNGHMMPGVKITGRLQ